MKKITKRIGMTYAQIVSNVAKEAYALIEEHSQKFVANEFFEIFIEYNGHKWMVSKYHYRWDVLKYQEAATRTIRFKNGLIMIGTYWNEDKVYIVVDDTLYELFKLRRPE